MKVKYYKLTCAVEFVYKIGGIWYHWFITDFIIIIKKKHADVEGLCW